MADLGNMGGSQLAEPSNDYTPIPAGVYDLEVSASDIVQTKAGTGLMLKLQLRVTGPDYEGRVIFDQINIQNASQQAQEIGQRQLSDLSRACGFAANPQDSQEFHGIPIRARVKVKSDPQYGDRNEIARYLEPDETAPAHTRQTAQARPASATNNTAAGGRPRPAFLDRKRA